MGAMAEGFVAYVQPLIEKTNGSREQMEKAFSLGQLCYNLALLPEDSREKAISRTRESLQMDEEEEFEAFKQSIILPMIQRHQEMFPQLHRRNSSFPMQSELSPWDQPRTEGLTELSPGTDRYVPCPCQSGKKYKFCCGKKGR